MTVVAGIDLGGTVINYTFCDPIGSFLVDGLCEFPARLAEGPQVCLEQIAVGLQRAADHAHIEYSDVIVAGIATPGPASIDGVLSVAGSTNFAHPGWAGFDLPTELTSRLWIPVVYAHLVCSSIR